MGTKSSKPFTPTYMDVCAARAALKSLNLPTELVLQVLDHARYWPIHDFTGSNVSVSSNRADIALLECVHDRANNIPAIYAGGEALKIKEIEFIIKSKDQGWTSEGTEETYQTSSWLEVSILRPEGTGVTAIGTVWADLWRTCKHSGDFENAVRDKGWSLIPRVASAMGPQGDEDKFAWFLQANKVAARETYQVVWAEDRWIGNDGSGKGEGFLEMLKEGDRIVVWARAKYPGWTCTVDRLDMTVRYGF